jgi:hypothetical protein
MNRLLKKLWNDQGGFILSTEAMILWTICVLGLIVGLVAVRDAANTELVEVANTILSFDQSYSYAGLSLTGGSLALAGGQDAVTNGSNAQDWPGTSNLVSGPVTNYGITATNPNPVVYGPPDVIAIVAP